MIIKSKYLRIGKIEGDFRDKYYVVFEDFTIRKNQLFSHFGKMIKGNEYTIIGDSFCEGILHENRLVFLWANSIIELNIKEGIFRKSNDFILSNSGKSTEKLKEFFYKFCNKNNINSNHILNTLT